MKNFVPGLLPRLPSHRRFTRLSMASDYQPPKIIDSRFGLLKSSNQGNSPKCAAYEMAGFIEYFRWKYDGIIAQVDPNPIYDRAKQIDDFPNEDGTSLNAVLQAAQDLNLMSAVAQERILEVSTVEEVKRALHKYGVVLTAFNCTDEWGNASPDGWINPNGNFIGGHAVLTCYSNDLDVRPHMGIQNSWDVTVGWQGFERMDTEEYRRSFEYGLVLDFPH